MGFLARSPSSGGGPTRQTSEADLNQFNVQLRSQPWYQQFFQERGLDPNNVQLSRRQQGELEALMQANGLPLQSGMHIDQAGNLNQKNRLGRNVAIGAGIATGGYFAAPALAGALGAGGGAGGGAAAGGAGAAGGGAAAGAIPTIGGTALTTGMAGVAPSLAGASTLAGGAAATGGGAGAGGLLGKLGAFSKTGLGQAAMRGGGALFAALMAKRAQSGAMKRSPEEAAALTGLQGTAGQLGQAGSRFLQQGQPLTTQASDYWSTLLSGNRAQMALATAAPRAAISDVYRGAESHLERSGVRGASRDVAKAELGRERASKIAGLTTGVQPFAAQQVGELGFDASRMGAGMLGASGGIFSDLLGRGFQNRVYGRGEGEKAGTQWGSLIFDLLSGYGKTK